MTENVQKAHYEAIHDEYGRHYYDETSLDYRREFIIRVLIDDLDLTGKRIADLACGSGWNTLLLQEQISDATYVGFDISEPACKDYENHTGYNAKCCDLSADPIDGELFDVAIIVGGLHHMINDLPSTAAGIAKMLKPGGYLLAYEPNAEFFLNGIRDYWYKKDRYFDELTERPLTEDELLSIFKSDFSFVDSTFLGGPAYFLILNSLVTRVPLALKKPIVPILKLAEAGYNKLPGKRPFPAFVTRWQRL